MKNIINNLYHWYNQYYESFKHDDIVIQTNISSKKEHTFRVCKNILDIGKSLNLSERDLILAETIGLFHDLGRFEQFATYKTFRDAVSEDHGALSVTLLMKFDILQEFTDYERDLITKAIHYHNKLNISADETEEIIFFSKLIRDADKLDIFELLISYYEESHKFKNTAFEDYPQSDDYNPIFIEAVLFNKAVNYHDVKTTTDIKLMRLSWIYDINFKRSFEVIRERLYVERLINVLPEMKEKEEINHHILKYIDNKIL